MFGGVASSVLAFVLSPQWWIIRASSAVLIHQSIFRVAECTKKQQVSLIIWAVTKILYDFMYSMWGIFTTQFYGN